MGINILDQLLSATGFSTKPADDAVREARGHYLGTSGRPDLGGLIPGMEAELGYRDEYLDEFTGERTRILDQTDINREQQGQFNEVALAQLPGLAEAATVEGFTGRIDELSADPNMRRILERQENERARAAEASLSAGGLQRSGAAATAAARETLTPEEFAFSTEQMLFDRSLGLTGLYDNLPIANAMIPDTLARDLSISKNLVEQGKIRGDADLLMGQISNEAGMAMLENLLKVYGAATSGGSGPQVSIINDIENQITDWFEGVVEGGGVWIEDKIGDIWDWVTGDDDDPFDDGSGDYEFPAPEPQPGDPNLPDIPPDIVPDPDIPPVAEVPAPEPEPIVPEPEPEPVGELPGLEPEPEPEPEPEAPPAEEPAFERPEGFEDQQWEDLKDDLPDEIPPEFKNKDEWLAAVVEWMREVARQRQEQGEPPPEEVPENLPGPDVPPIDPTAPGDEDVGIADPDNPPYAGEPGFDLPGIELPDYDNPINIGDDDPFDRTKPPTPTIGFPGDDGIGNSLVEGPSPFPGPGDPFPTPTIKFPTLPDLGTWVGQEILGEIGTNIGEDLFGRKATTNVGSGAGSYIGGMIGGPLGSVIGAGIGGLVDAAFGTSDQKNVTTGFATTQPGDDVSGEVTLDSGLKLWGIARRVDDEVSNAYMNTAKGIDKYLLDVANAGGFDVSLRNFGEDIPTFGGEVEGKGKNLKANPTFFGSATEGSKESKKKYVGENMGQGINDFTDAWLRAAVDQGQITGEKADQVLALTGKDMSANDLMAEFQIIMTGYDPRTAIPDDDLTVPSGTSDLLPTPGELPGMINPGYNPY